MPDSDAQPSVARPAPRSNRPRIDKTHDMLVIERNNNGEDIRDTITDALKDFDRDRDAADHIGIYPSTLSHWIARLNITFEVEEIRVERRTSAVAS